MLTQAIVVVVAAVAGFGAGRIPSGKLAAIKAELAKIETEAVTDAKAVVARIKKLL
jgi:hypothetical protein